MTAAFAAELARWWMAARNVRYMTRARQARSSAMPCESVARARAGGYWARGVSASVRAVREIGLVYIDAPVDQSSGEACAGLSHALARISPLSSPSPSVCSFPSPSPSLFSTSVPSLTGLSK